jgi:hypothetical protein
MTSNSIIARLRGLIHPNRPYPRRSLQEWHQNQAKLPKFVRQSAVAQRYLRLLGPLAWNHFPERDLRLYGQTEPVPYAPFAAACLIKLDQQLVSMSELRTYLVEHPELLWLVGFPTVPDRSTSWGFDPEASLPTGRHFTRMLRTMPNQIGQFLLDSTVTLIQQELAKRGIILGQIIALDTKHILAWVEENNPKAYVPEGRRLDKTQQPKGDADCKLGCKRKRNRPPAQEQGQPDTPTKNPIRPTNFSPKDEYYWGYASGIVVTKVPGYGEFVLAELTQTFDLDDLTYFFPLLTQTERRLGHKPPYGALDAAFDAFYVYEYFHQAGGLAAVPFVKRGGYTHRSFDPDGLPLCQAGLPMPLKSTYQCKTTLVEHERGRYGCPLLHPTPTGQPCPVDHKQWPKGGCTTTMPTSIGARLRYQLDRDSDAYKTLYNYRSATERINSQAKALGIERPKLRNQQAIANLNTLIYVLINLRAFHRLPQPNSLPPL